MRKIESTVDGLLREINTISIDNMTTELGEQRQHLIDLQKSNMGASIPANCQDVINEINKSL